MNFAPLGWTHVETTRLTIGAGVTRTVDLGWLPEQLYNFSLGVKPPPLSEIHELPPGTWELTLAVGARNADARHFRVGLTFDGTWGRGGEDVWNHLRVTRPREVDPPESPKALEA
jgi:hypothetical protein